MITMENSISFFLYSQACHLAAPVPAEFAGKGNPVMELKEGFDKWKDYDLEIEE